MVTKKRGVKNTVKIDEKLLQRVKLLFADEEINIKYPTIKNFINIAVLNLLKTEEKNEKIK